MEKIKTEIDKIIKSYGFNCKVYFRGTKSKEGVGGYCKSNGEYIVISTILKNRTDIISTLFHEMGHIYCVENKKHYNYHRVVTNKEQAYIKIKSAIKAERYVDKWGERELKKYDSRIKWKPTYFSKDDVKWWKEIWAKRIKEEWLDNNKEKIFSNLH